MTDERFDDLLAAYLEGDISEQELSELHEAVHASDRFRQRFQEETRLHVLLRETLIEQIELQSLQETVTPPHARSSRLWTYVAAAATAAIVIISAVIGYSVYPTGSDSAADMGICLNVFGSGELVVERNSERTRLLPDSPLAVGDRLICGAHAQAMLRLSDGSILSMEPESRLTLVSDRPEVKLDHGEVLFEIAARDANMPTFEVRTGNSTVAVMGTVFTLAANGHTKLQVYEGRVTLTRHSDKASVEVGTRQMTTTDAEGLVVQELSAPAPSPSAETLSLLPTDDVTLDRGQREAGRHLKVEGQRRTAYLRYVVPDVGTFRSARLRLTQDVDPGTGTLQFFVGDHSQWNEGDLTQDNAPRLLRNVARRTGVVRRGEIIEIDVSDAVRRPGPITIVITLDKPNENDIWFGSKESEIPPQLILTYLPQPPRLP